MAEKLIKKLPINCPFCDEIAYQKPRVHRVVTENAIYTLRQCIMGHEFYSVETVPENQKEIVNEVRRIKYGDQSGYVD
jgi:hypothetical protein